MTKLLLVRVIASTSSYGSMEVKVSQYEGTGYHNGSLREGKVVISRNVAFAENDKWNWEQQQIMSTTPPVYSIESLNIDDDELDVDQTVDEASIKKTRSIQDIYDKCHVALLELASFDKALKHAKWNAAMKEEIKMTEQNNTWSLVDRTRHRQVIGVNRIFKRKLNENGSLNRCNARLVAKVYAQLASVDYQETFATVARLETIRLAKEIYVEQPMGFKIEFGRDKVYKLHKALYGLKQAPHAWYSRIDTYLNDQEFCKSVNKATLHTLKKSNDAPLIVSLYVDDLLIIEGSAYSVNEFKAQMQREFKMSDCKAVATPLIANEIQFVNARDNLENPSQYRSLIGGLLYICTTRPKIMFAKIVAQSTAKAEYVATASTTNQAIWWRKVSFDLGMSPKNATKLSVDNKSAISMAKNQVDFGDVSAWMEWHITCNFACSLTFHS
ncbi:Uncharacterized protein TCM_028442 [Theobroma cacao]|uniref:Reverse transcriptase Ty1/copia-type domain-containing protein n=1 Tax=Theobroma cacao TaxID=3641 RepID=A0A061GAK6_THECC|nr:Uncharacterized protein TCM_028442 [Theobroma cacao]